MNREALIAMKEKMDAAGLYVKPMEWTEAEFGGTWYAETIFGTYSAWEIGSGYYRPPNACAGLQSDGPLPSALADAYADYESRILSALIAMEPEEPKEGY